MSTNPFTAVISSLLILLFLTPASLFVAPKTVHAQGVPTGDFTTEFQSTISAIQNTLDTVYDFTSSVANYANWVNTYVLQPIAFVMSGELMKALTASVMKFVIGKANGTGIPQFVVDVRQSLRSISDFQNEAYLRQVSLTNSPFATSIAQALNIDYNQKTSLAGYWAANMNTLGQNIPTYQPGFLTGNWSQGGVAAWFQLTTQSQNNPYMLYQNAQAKRDSLIGPGVGGGTGARLAELQWGKGFMSWCATEQTGVTGNNPSAYTANTVTTGNNPSAFTANAQGVNPGDPCTNKDGTPGKTQTPGSVISGVFDKVLGGQQDKLVQMGNISSQVNSILGNIGTVLNTINLAANILGGSSGGLLNAGSSSGALTKFGAPPLATTGNFTSENGYGISESQITSTAASSEVTAAKAVNTDDAVSKASSDALVVTQNMVATVGYGGSNLTAGGSDMPSRVQQYQTAWNAIASVASTTSSSLKTMMSVCHAYWNGNSKYENDAQNALSFEVVPVLTQAAGIQAIVDAALAQDALVKSEATTKSTYSANLQKLNTMTPTASDVATAQYNATAYGAAKANPIGSLTVTGGSIVDQMNLIRNNASYMQSAFCTAPENTGGGA